VEVLNNKVLAPSFRIKGGLKEQMEILEQQAQRILTDEQERILAETELDNRKLFLGAAGTGKTFLAIEKAKRLAAQSKKVLLTCFNRNLATYMRQLLPDSVTVFNFHDYQLLHGSGVVIGGL
jgi:superfamily I DNA and RNA helicase